MPAMGARSVYFVEQVLEGKTQGPRSGATINEPQYGLSAFALAHNLQSTTNQQQAVRFQDGWSSRLAFIVG
jgi:hypothetical protein